MDFDPVCELILSQLQNADIEKVAAGFLGGFVAWLTVSMGNHTRKLLWWGCVQLAKAFGVGMQPLGQAQLDALGTPDVRREDYEMLRWGEHVVSLKPDGPLSFINEDLRKILLPWEVKCIRRKAKRVMAALVAKEVAAERAIAARRAAALADLMRDEASLVRTVPVPPTGGCSTATPRDLRGGLNERPRHCTPSCG